MPISPLLETPLIELHRELGAKLVDFSGWSMPLHYGSQVEEHHSVRTSAGLFDVSHMTVVDVSGDDAVVYLRYLLANDVARLQIEGAALYTAMLNEQGGVIDDLIVYRIDGGRFRLVVNCATRAKDLDWMQARAEKFAVLIVERPELAMLAVQGPAAREAVHRVLDDVRLNELPTFSATELVYDAAPIFVARTGYTGEDGYEIIVPAAKAETFARALLAQGVLPCGLGARDTLRLEAGLNLYGHEMDESVSPLEANMAWTVAWLPDDRDFIGRSAIAQQRAVGVENKLVGLLIQGRGVLRAGQTVHRQEGDGRGLITSGTYSPTLATSIALARVPRSWEGECSVSIRGKAVPVRIVKPAFVRRGLVL